MLESNKEEEEEGGRVRRGQDPSQAPYWGTSLIRNSLPLGTYSSMCLGPYDGPGGGGMFLMDEVPLYWRLAMKITKQIITAQK